MKLISEYWEDNGCSMGDDTLVEVARSFEIDTEREVDRYVSVEIRCGIEARDKDNEAVTDPDEIAKLEEELLEWSDARGQARQTALALWSSSPGYFMRWEDSNPKPIRYVWEACVEYATKDDLEAEYENHEYEYGESYSYTSFSSEAAALEDAKQMLRSSDWERDFGF